MVIDLYGHNLTVTGALSPSSTADAPAIITNSLDGTTSTVKFDLVQGLGSEEFRKLRFGGDLAVSIRGDFSNASFMNGVSKKANVRLILWGCGAEIQQWTGPCSGDMKYGEGLVIYPYEET